MKRLFVLAGLMGVLLFPGARAEAQDDQYVRIYNLIQEADVLDNSNQAGQALTRYIEAQRALEKFQKMYPDWNRRVVNFRLNYLASRITEISGKVPPVPPAAAVRSETNAPGPFQPRERTELENQLNALQNQVRQLQADKHVLEAKLKEALAAQPAAVDPRELAKAEEKIRALEKENGLLQVSLAQQQTKAPAAADTTTLERLKRDLADASRKLAEQTQKANALALEKQALQNQLDSLTPASPNASNLEATREALEEANRKLAEQTERASKLSQEKDSLQARVKTLAADVEAMAALHAENEILKKQLAELKRPAHPSPSLEANRQLAEARAQIAALQSDKEILRLEKTALENRVQQLSAPATNLTVLSAVQSAEDAARVTQLERERAELQKKLDAAQRELYGRKRKSVAARIADLTGQLEVLRTRLAVYEAQQVPYTDEELALFKKGQDALATANPKAGQKSARDLPAGTATLVAEARRDFAAKQFVKAEEKYVQVLQKNENNVYTLANLATIQLELGHLDDAEKHVQQAVALSPDDVYSLLVLGEIKFRREKYEAALDALSRAAKLDPQNAEIQNYLGLTLSEKGMRHPAETAFRKAIQLDPKYGSAHYNLAVFYITQKPPWPELARWHYKKALDTGFLRNPDLEKMLDRTKTEEAGH